MAKRKRSFSDDDLKRLKKSLQNDSFWYLEYELPALLFRLAAAEKALEESYRNLDSGVQFNDIDKLYEAWRKAAGK